MFQYKNVIRNLGNHIINQVTLGIRTVTVTVICPNEPCNVSSSWQLGSGKSDHLSNVQHYQLFSNLTDVLPLTFVLIIYLCLGAGLFPWAEKSREESVSVEIHIFPEMFSEIIPCFTCFFP